MFLQMNWILRNPPFLVQIEFNLPDAAATIHTDLVTRETDHVEDPVHHTISMIAMTNIDPHEAAASGAINMTGIMITIDVVGEIVANDHDHVDVALIEDVVLIEGSPAIREGKSQILSREINICVGLTRAGAVPVKDRALAIQIVDVIDVKDLKLVEVMQMTVSREFPEVIVSGTQLIAWLPIHISRKEMRKSLRMGRKKASILMQMATIYFGMDFSGFPDSDKSLISIPAKNTLSLKLHKFQVPARLKTWSVLQKVELSLSITSL